MRKIVIITSLFETLYFLFTRLASPSGIYGTLLYGTLIFGIYGTLVLPLMLLKTTAKKKTLVGSVHIYSHGIAGFTMQRTVNESPQRLT